jgi:hypothetical protein
MSDIHIPDLPAASSVPLSMVIPMDDALGANPTCKATIQQIKDAMGVDIVGTTAYTALVTAWTGTSTGLSLLRTSWAGTASPSALLCDQSGSNNVAVGLGSMQFRTTAYQNVAIGVGCLPLATFVNNIAIGHQTQPVTTTGNSDVAVGSNSLCYNTTGSQNVGVGVSTLAMGTIANNNTGVGHNAGFGCTGSDNVAVGCVTMFDFTGSNTVAVGASAMQHATGAASRSVAIGYQSQRVSVGVNTSVGYQALAANTAGDSGVAVGDRALAANTTGFANTAVGMGAMQGSTAGGSNVAVGRLALGKSVPTWHQGNTVVGFNACFGMDSAAGNTALGHSALFTATSGTYNTAVGSSAGNFVTSGVSNTVVGAFAQSSGLATPNQLVVLGAFATAAATACNVIGYNGTNRVTQTTTLAGPLLVRRDNGEGSGSEVLIYSGAEVVVMSKEVALTSTGTQTVSLPAGAHFYPDEVGVVVTDADTVTVQPFVKFGVSGNTVATVAAVQTSAIAAKYDRQRYASLLTGAGQTTLTGAVHTAATATSLRGRYYWRGMLLED